MSSSQIFAGRLDCLLFYQYLLQWLLAVYRFTINVSFNQTNSHLFFNRKRKRFHAKNNKNINSPISKNVILQVTCWLVFILVLHRHKVFQPWMTHGPWCSTTKKRVKLTWPLFYWHLKDNWQFTFKQTLKHQHKWNKQPTDPKKYW